jgi:hypothetical protein
VLAEQIWHERVQRRLERDGLERGREASAAAHTFLAAVEGEPADWLGRTGLPPTEVEERALREFWDALGRITGVGPGPWT